MKKKLLFALIPLYLALSGCAAELAAARPSGETLRVYRVFAPEYRSERALLSTEPAAVSPGGDPVLRALEALAETPEDAGLRSPVPKGVGVVGTQAEGRHVTVRLNAGYLDITGLEKTLLNACVTLTLCSLEGVDFVSIRVGSELVGNRLSPADFLLFDNIVNGSKAQVRISFPSKYGQALGSEFRTISFDGDNSAERVILDVLFGGPSNQDLRRAFPIGAVVLSVYTLEGLCTVSLSGIDPANMSVSAANARLAVYALVNSLTELSSIRSVQILIDGQQRQSLWGFDIYAPLTRNEDIIGSPVS
ncbi:MAG: GerMN domain-containing protein [Oscillospiraceae bacterium]|jgi:germination protein M|nr:GerMN domain-containing protein [Oscillospiraceae bacterium]